MSPTPPLLASRTPTHRNAGFISRGVALAIDLAIIWGALLFHNLLWQALFGSRWASWIGAALGSVLPDSGLGLGEIARGLPVVLGLLIGCGYFVFFFSVTGQTIGKRVMGIVVVDQSGRYLTARQAALRLCGYLISALPVYMGFLAVLTDGRRRAWHDRMARTEVLYYDHYRALRSGSTQREHLTDRQQVR